MPLNEPPMKIFCERHCHQLSINKSVALHASNKKITNNTFVFTAFLKSVVLETKDNYFKGGVVEKKVKNH